MIVAVQTAKRGPSAKSAASSTRGRRALMDARPIWERRIPAYDAKQTPTAASTTRATTPPIQCRPCRRASSVGAAARRARHPGRGPARGSPGGVRLDLRGLRLRAARRTDPHCQLAVLKAILSRRGVGRARPECEDVAGHRHTVLGAAGTACGRRPRRGEAADAMSAYETGRWNSARPCSPGGATRTRPRPNHSSGTGATTRSRSPPRTRTSSRLWSPRAALGVDARAWQ